MLQKRESTANLAKAQKNSAARPAKPRVAEFSSQAFSGGASRAF
jgi:hypothetical protein